MPSITIIAALGITIRNTAFSITIKNTALRTANKMQHINIKHTQHNNKKHNNQH
jgi:hypothetical protein